MTPQTVARINAAINDCLEQCYAAEMPLATLAQYLERLRTNCRWNDHELEEVEFTVLRMLRQIAEVDDPQSATTSSG